jgi:hypothetical protein
MSAETPVETVGAHEAAESPRTLFPNGHFYSPVVDAGELRERKAALWRQRDVLPGIDLNPESQRRFLEESFPRHFSGFTYPRAPEDAVDARGRQRYFVDNDQFSHIDAGALFVMLCELRPKRVVEVGSGFSTLLMVDVRDRLLDGASIIECVEPYPRHFLLDPAYGISLIQEKVQDVAPEYFEGLESGDVLFIDTSHVSKTGSDVNRLVLDILPRLKPGVYVHVHDIFLPEEYPPSWVLDENRSWNEQYLLQAFLINNSKAKVLYATGYARSVLTPLARTAVAGKLEIYGGSFWFRVIGDEAWRAQDATASGHIPTYLR